MKSGCSQSKGSRFGGSRGRGVRITQSQRAAMRIVERLCTVVMMTVSTRCRAKSRSAYIGRGYGRVPGCVVADVLTRPVSCRSRGSDRSTCDVALGTHSAIQALLSIGISRSRRRGCGI